MKETKTLKKVCRGLLLVAICLVALITFFNVSASAATRYEVTKSGGALVRISYSEKAASVRREPQGSIIWVVSSKVNSAGNTWYKLSDGNWIFSGNVKVHSCTWTRVGGYNPTCTYPGINNYRCNKCGNEKSTGIAAPGHKYEGNVCKTCGVWNTSSLKSKTAVNIKLYVKTNGAKVHSGPYGACATVQTLSKGAEIVATEKIVNASGNTWYRYSGGYIFKDYVIEHNSCLWDIGTVTKKATCTNPGAKVYHCLICGRSKTNTLSPTGHKYDANVCTTCGGWNTSSLKSKTSVNNVKYYVKSNGAKVHSGPYAGCAAVNILSKGAEIVVVEKIVNASGNTWYRYSGGYIFKDYVVEHDSCSWDKGTVTKKATCTATGTKVHKCTICGKSKTVTLAKVSHKYQSNVCTACGAWDKASIKSQTAIKNVKYYIAKDVVVRTGPYAGCKKVKTLPAGTEIIVTQKIVNGSKNTWYKYDGGYIFCDNVVKHASHSWDSGRVTKKATCTATGTKTYHCTICGKGKTETIAKVAHKYKDHVCTACGNWNTSSLKFQTTVKNVKYYITKTAYVRTGPYSGCKTLKKLPVGTEIIVTQKVVNGYKNTWYKYEGGYIYEESLVKHDSHSWDSGKVTKKATCTATGTKVHKCTICGGSKTVTVAKVAHKYKDHVCSVCGNWNKSSIKSQASVKNVKYYVTKTAYVRTGPYSGCKTLKKLPVGTEIIVTQKVVNGYKNTWYKYEGGYIYEESLVKHDSHSWDSGKVTKKATCTATGTKVYKCTVCAKSKTETIAKVAHKYKDHVCTVCGTWNKSSIKSQTAVKNVKYYISKAVTVRTGPYSGCKKVKTLPAGTVITATEKIVNGYKNTWFKYEGGYIYSENLIDYALHTATITLNSKNTTLYVEQATTLKATVKGPSSKVTWKSSNSSIATVDANGKITGKKTGTCTITAKANGKTVTCKITVKQLAAPTGVKLTTSNNGRYFRVSHNAVSGADGYEVTYMGGLTNKSATYTKTYIDLAVPMADNCSYRAVVRAYKLIGGKKYYSKSSETVSVHVHNAKTDIAAKRTVKYSVVDGTYHLEKVSNTFSCAGCKKSITYTKETQIKHGFICGVCQTCGKTKAADYVVGKIYPNVGKGPAYSSAEKKGDKNPIYAAAKYSDKFFVGNSSTFSKDLCKLSAVGAAASYTQKFGKSFLEECGFTNIKAANSSSNASMAVAGKNDHARYIIGHKKISGTDKTLVAVLVNGYTTGAYEWISNFNVGKSGLHEGFSKAANEITAQINAYIREQKIDTSKVKIWITGHSRGGAVTGMAAVQLNAKYGHANVYAYGFATPNGVPTSMVDKVYSGNIFNIINPGDFVPYVVPSSWGFTKYGSTKVLTVNTTAMNLYSAMSKDAYDGLTESGRKSLINAFCEYAPNRKAYYTVNGSASPSYFGRALGLFLSDAGLCKEAIDLLAKCGISDGDSAGVLLQMVYNGKMTTNIHEAHCMETYIAMVYAAYP